LWDLLGHDPVQARTARDRWRSVAVVRNVAARARAGVALLRLTTFLADEPVGHPGAPPTSITAPTAPLPAPALDGVPLQVLDHSVTRDRVESPRHYPDNDLVATALVAAWLPPVAGYGTLAIPHADRPTSAPGPDPAVEVGDTWMTNQLLRVDVARNGDVRVTQLETGTSVSPLLTFEDLRDAGDLYTPAPRPPAAVARFTGLQVTHHGPLRGEIVASWALERRGVEASDVAHISVSLILDAAAPFLRLAVDGVSLAFDHRLRIVVNTGVTGPEVHADAMFGSVRRAPIVVPPEDAASELPPPTAPLHRYVSLFSAAGGATVYSDGLAEYEATPGGGVAITLVRGVGMLSRNDLPERPGHAGWPEETPWAQSPGPFEARLAYLPHGGARDPATVDRIERIADDVLLPLTGETLRSALTVPAPTAGIALEGEGLAFSAAKDSDDGEWVVLRCVNLLDEARDGAWRLGFPVVEARRARLDETPADALGVDDGRVTFDARAREIVTILVR
jgi:hypothetical protein